MTDKKITYISSASVFAALLIALFVPFGESGRIFAAALLLPAAILISIFLKKRDLLSINNRQVLLIMAVTAVVIVIIYYLTGIKFGFYRNLYKFSLSGLFKYILPITVIVASTELIRSVLLAQKGALPKVLCYFACVVADMLICSNVPSVTTFNRFMELIAGAFFPALTANLLYNYLTKRYGIYPNIAFRLITTLHAYIFSVESGISDSVWNFIRLVIPIALFAFIDVLYERKRRYALKNISPIRKFLAGAVTVIVLLFMTATVMLVSNQFYYGALVIATPSMTGELNQGDAAIFERYEDQTINEGQVIVFERDGVNVVHRVVDKQTINGIVRYYTKGDANEDMDAGYVLDEEIVGLVNHKIPYIGYPTLWMRSLFKR